MKHSVCIIVCYFGKFPSTINSFLYSCQNNEEFNWIIFTDCKIEKCPKNVRVVYTTLEFIKELAEKNLGQNIVLQSAYKLCDYRPAYGLIFQDYLKGYDFWGYGDIDVVYGNLNTFITDEVLDNYDKIYPFGHLSLVRNNKICNTIFMQEVNDTNSYECVFNTNTSCFFDEYKGFSDKLEAKGLKLYNSFDFADIDGVYKRFRTADKKTLKVVFPNAKKFYGIQTNYKHQLFYLSKGILYKSYIKNGVILTKEIVYIHYRRKMEVKWNEYDEVMILCPKGILPLDHIPNKDDIYKYNSVVENESVAFLKFAIPRVYLRIVRTAKDRAISVLGKSQMLVHFVQKVKRQFLKMEVK